MSNSQEPHRYCVDMKVPPHGFVRRKVKKGQPRSLLSTASSSASTTRSLAAAESKQRVYALPKPARAAFQKRGLWPNESTLRIRFLNGTSAQHRFVQKTAAEWTKYANLKFKYVDSGRTDLRIAFDKGQGSWSYVGTDNLDIPQHAATMNLGWLDRVHPTDGGTILHEFGHAIGLVHEHMRPGAFEWNRDAVIADLSGPPNYWDVETIEDNVLNAYDKNDLISTEAIDSNSIMMYSYPSEWLIGSEGTPANETLSQLDKEHAKAVYPGATGEIQLVDETKDDEKDAENDEESQDEWTIPEIPTQPQIEDGEDGNGQESNTCSCLALFSSRKKAHHSRPRTT